MRIIVFTLVFFLSLCLSECSPSTAQPQLSLDAAADEFVTNLDGTPKLINVPAPAQWAINRSSQGIAHDALPGGKGQRARITEQGENGYEVTAAAPITQPIKTGDVLLVAFYARGEEAFNEANTAIITSGQIELTRAPYTAAGRSAIRLKSKWDIYYLNGKAERDYDIGDAQVSLHLAGSRQTIDLGPAFVFNFGPDMDVAKLPRNLITYQGREADAPWRALAQARIEQHRKGDLLVSVTDSAGIPVSGATVDITLRKHAYGFGTVTSRDFANPDGSGNPIIKEKFETLFNMATSPVYWADWGWQDPQRRADYKAKGKYLTANNIPWRAHPIMWPGEPYMPKVLLDLEGQPAEQREWVLSHVREVMDYLEPLGPMAIDLTNEPRVNQYFIENGNPQLVTEVFALVHSIAPDVPLFINDYAILNGDGVNTGNIEFYKTWLRKMQADNVPVGGIGFQAHFSSDLTAPQRVYDIIDEFDQFDLPIHITEFDIQTLDEQAQADYTRDFLTIAFSHPRTEAFVMWGFWEGDHWKPEAAMFRKDWSEKPNAKAWRETVYETFWTNESTLSDVSGQAELRGFYGDYDVTVTHDGTTKTLQTTLSKTEDNIFAVTLD